jgi:UPF0716 protein FxsA
MYRILLFVGLPLVEMALLIWVGDAIGIFPTLGIVILTGIVGASLVKRQGLAVWQEAKQRLGEGGLPTRELAHGAMLLVAGAFLLTPGFITDLTGFALLVPTVREWLRGRFGSRFARRMESEPVRVEVWRV